MQFKLFSLINKFAFIFKFFNIDYDEVKAITEMKLLAGSRKSPIDMQQNKNENETKNKFNIGLLFLIFFGFIIGLMINKKIDIIYNMAIMTGILIFYMVFYILSDFTSIFLDLRDRKILSVLPVKQKSISVAKIIYASIHLSLTCLSLTFGWYIIGSYKYNLLFSLALIISNILIIILCVTITTIIYGLLMKKFSGDKLNEIINNAQIIATVVFMIGYQVVIRLFSVVEISGNFDLKFFHFLIPTTWYGGIFDLIVNQNINFNTIILTILGILVPIFLIHINQNYILPNFEKNLSKLENTSTNDTYKGESFISKLMPFSNQIEEASFYLTKKIMRKDKDFKLRVVSTMAMAIIFPIIMIFTRYDNDISILEFLESLKNSRSYSGLYFFNLMFLPVISDLFVSKNPEKANIFKCLPIKKPSDINKGLIKAFNISYTLPCYLVVSVIFVFLFGIKIIPYLFLVFINLILSEVIFLAWLKKRIPFSGSIKDDGVDRFESGLASFAITLFLGLINYFTLKHSSIPDIFIIITFTLINIGLIVFLWKKKINYTWEKLK